MADHSLQKQTPKPRKGAVVFDAVKGGTASKTPALAASHVAKKGKKADPYLLETLGKWQERADRPRAKTSPTKIASPGELALPEVAPDVQPSAYSPDARGRAILRGVRMTEDMLKAAGGAFDLAEVQAIFRGVSRQAIDKRVQEGSLLAVPGPNGSRRYPVGQFLSDGSLVKGLKEVHAALPVRAPWSAFLFLMQPHDGLNGRTPLDALREGDLDLVIAAAQRLGVQGS